MIEVRARPLTWTAGQPHPDGWQAWHTLTAVSIIFDPAADAQARFIAEWNEHHSETFETLGAAKHWCQRRFDAWIREMTYALVAPACTWHPYRFVRVG